MQFSAPAPVGFLPPPEMGEGWGGGEEHGSKHTWPLPPHPCLPPRWGEGADAAVMHGENRELHSPGGGSFTIDAAVQVCRDFLHGTRAEQGGD